MYWYHGVPTRHLASVLENGFNPGITTRGKDYGPGTYFAATELAARSYHETILKVDLSSCSLVWIINILGTAYTLTPEGYRRTFKDDANNFQSAGKFAKSSGYDGTYITGFTEKMIATVTQPENIKILEYYTIDNAEREPVDNPPVSSSNPFLDD